MDCARFSEHVEELVSDGEVRRDAAEHAAECRECGALLLRARRVATLLAESPAIEPPADLSERVHSAAFATRSIGPSRLIRAAAAIVLFAVGGLAAVAFFGRGGPDGSDAAGDYEPLQVRVVKVDGNGALDETFALEGMYGPDAAMLVADGGEPDNTDDR